MPILTAFLSMSYSKCAVLSSICCTMKQAQTRLFWLFSSFLLLSLFLTACNRENNQENLRAKLIRKSNTQEVIVGIVWPNRHSAEAGDFLDGVDLAVTEVNNKGISIKGKTYKLKTIYIRENTGTNEISSQRNYTQYLARKAAYQAVQYPQMVAVIGHRFSSAAIPASLIYKQAGMLYIAPTASNLELTRPYFQNTFRISPNNDVIAQQLIAYCHYNNLHKLVIVSSSDSAYSTEMTNSLVKYIVDNNNSPYRKYELTLVKQISFFAQKQTYNPDFRKYISEFRGEKFDAILLTNTPNVNIEFIKQTREMGIMSPFVGDIELGFKLKEEEVVNNILKDIRNISNEDKEKFKIIVPILYNPMSNLSDQFIKKFKQQYGQNQNPTDLAVIGYDAIKLLEHALEGGNSNIPIVIANTLRYMKVWVGVGGPYFFEKKNGELAGKTILFSKLTTIGKLELLPNAHLNFLFDRLRENRIKANNKAGSSIVSSSMNKPSSLVETPVMVSPPPISEPALSAEPPVVSSPPPVNEPPPSPEPPVVPSPPPVNEPTSSTESPPVPSPPPVNESTSSTEPPPVPSSPPVNNEPSSLVEPLAVPSTTSPSASIKSSILLSSQLVANLLDENSPNQLLGWGAYVDIPLQFTPNSVDSIAHPEKLEEMGKVLSHPFFDNKSILIQAHSDNIGSKKTNLLLSTERAKFVKQYLVDKFNIDSQRIVVEGRGEADPIAPNTTPKGRAINRRIRIAVK